MEEQKRRKWKGNRNGNKKETKRKKGNKCHILPKFGTSFPNCPQSLKTFPLIFWLCHSFLASPPGGLKIGPGKECDALVWSAKTADPFTCGARNPTWKKESTGTKKEHRGRGERQWCQIGCFMGREQERLADGVGVGQTLSTLVAANRAQDKSHLWLPGWPRRGQRNLKLLPCTSCSVYNVKVSFPATLGPFGSPTTSAKEICRLDTHWVYWV